MRQKNLMKTLHGDFQLGVNAMEGQPPLISIRKFYRKDNEMNPGLPGMELTERQFNKLRQFRSLVQLYANNKTNVRCLLGYDREVKVKNGFIYLRKLPTYPKAINLCRDSLLVYPTLWDILWENIDWIQSELKAYQSLQMQVDAETSVTVDETTLASQIADLFAEPSTSQEPISSAQIFPHYEETMMFDGQFFHTDEETIDYAPKELFMNDESKTKKRKLKK
jgi:hypothetical protein